MKNRLSVWEKNPNFFQIQYSLFLPPEIKMMPEKYSAYLSTGKVEVGRWLFYDSILSRDKSISCASCHKPELGFTDSFSKSTGIKGQLSDKRTMPLHNLAWSRQFFWNGRSTTLEDAVMQPILNPGEMGSSIDQILDRLNRHPGYRIMFKTAFNAPEITKENVSIALSSFLLTLTSFNSKLDQIKRVDMKFWTAEDLASTDLQSGTMQNLEKEFVQIQAQCGSCHEPAMNGYSVFENIGLDQTDSGGLGNISGNPQDFGKYKTPSLRNLLPGLMMMHDGRFVNLQQVLDHYESGIKNHKNLSARLKDGSNLPRMIKLDSSGRKGTEYFLTLLIDWYFLENPAFANPFIMDSAYLLWPANEKTQFDIDPNTRSNVLKKYQLIYLMQGLDKKLLASLIDQDYVESDGTGKLGLLKKFQVFEKDFKNFRWKIFPTLIYVLRPDELETLHIARVETPSVKKKVRFIPERIKWKLFGSEWKIVSWEHR